MYRVLACALAILLPLAGADFAILNLKVVEGEGMVYAPGSRATRGITLEITDETGRPVPGVAVSFLLPDEGASGVFLNGGRAEIVNTGEDGRATVWGMRWNKVPGSVRVRITAAKSGVRAGLIVTQQLDPSASVQTGAARHGGRSRMLLITLAVAGAAGAGLAAGALRGGGSAATTTPTAATSIGTPTVIIGAPQ